MWKGVWKVRKEGGRNDDRERELVEEKGRWRRFEYEIGNLLLIPSQYVWIMTYTSSNSHSHSERD